MHEGLWDAECGKRRRGEGVEGLQSEVHFVQANLNHGAIRILTWALSDCELAVPRACDMHSCPAVSLTRALEEVADLIAGGASRVGTPLGPCLRLGCAEGSDKEGDHEGGGV